MTDKTLHRFIETLNTTDTSAYVFKRPIGTWVEVAKVWMDPISPNDRVSTTIGDDRFFLLKNTEGQYVGAVYDMQWDLHAYMLPRYRKQGYMKKAFQQVIVPYLFDDDRNELRMTINRMELGMQGYTASRKLADSIGFKPVNREETEFELHREAFDWEGCALQETNQRLSTERYEELKRYMYYLSRCLYRTSDELLMAIDNDRELRAVAHEVRKYVWKIDDLEMM